MAGMQLEEVPRVRKWEGVRRLSLMKNKIKILICGPACSQLVTLLLQDNTALDEVIEDLFNFMDELIVLNLSNTWLPKLPRSIEKLVSLKFLDISYTVIRELPTELGKLSKLKHLNLSGLDIKVKKSEQVISGLSSLQVLKMLNCTYGYQEEEMEKNEGDKSTTDDETLLFEELRCLKHLNALHLTVTSVLTLERLNMIKNYELVTATEALFLKYVEAPKSLDICLLANIKNLSQVWFYSCDFEEMHAADSVTMETANAVGSFAYTSAISSNTNNFNCLRVVEVYACRYLKDLSWLVLVPNLTTLSVQDCRGMEEIISGVKLGEDADIIQADFKPFSKLKHLTFKDLPRLRCIYRNSVPLKDRSQFVIHRCQLLKKLPLDSRSGEGCKTQLEAERDWWEAIEWKDNATKAALLLRFKCTLS